MNSKLAAMVVLSSFLAGAGVITAACSTSEKEEPIHLKTGIVNDLAVLIRESQYYNVRPSYQDSEIGCFTDKNYETFVKNETSQEIICRLKGERKFMEGLLAFQALTAEEQEAFLAKSRRWLRPTWAELGRISIEGQTEAGQRAELDIANAIADAIPELSQLSVEELDNIYSEHIGWFNRLKRCGL